MDLIAKEKFDNNNKMKVSMNEKNRKRFAKTKNIAIEVLYKESKEHFK